MAINQLTDTAVKSFVRKETHDGKTKPSISDGGGLFLIKQGSTCSWFLKFQWTGKRKEMSLGKYPVVSLAEARELANDAKLKVSKGINPIQERAKSRQKPMTFGELADEYLELNHKQWTDKTQWQWETDLKDKCKPIRSKPIEDVDHHDVARLLKPIWLEKIETADRLHRRIRSVFKDAIIRELVSSNPADLEGPLRAQLPKRGKRIERNHASLPHSEVALFVERLRERRGLGPRALELIILTVLRSNELRGGQWSEIDFESRIWTVPAERMKERKEHRVPLSDRAIAILKEIKPKRRGKFIFPSEGQDGYISEASLRNILRKVEGGDKATIHGFRATFRTWIPEMTAFPYEMGEMALAHKVGTNVERAYQRSDMLHRRFELMNAWADYCDGNQPQGLIGGTDNVVEFKTA